ncbi:rRNA cytosine-C5-methyltransferase [Paenibacillus faecis]|uniref:rRNA cytosine-C5-methyltransferase n=1 Tax=Paenibacillus faecis TaxID=862114 RepID=A0A5D0CYJ6_9BACL|nr:RsmF rRNA methyltransferase first C-terminal domain-containing protein [Paenibacillus faecis]TYA14818.1 rRNA cytosine-C5-methyltransferase [Paenibacillus faecis]
MAVQLPVAFLQRMEAFLGDQYDDFLVSYDNPRYAGIRVNTLKIGVREFREISPFELRPIPWCDSGFYVDESLRPGKHPYYHAGLYYIQEPSAMAPAEVLDIRPGDRVLDLCAAPGGKSTQIAAKLNGQGILVTNDISAERTKALAKNMELYGVRNAIVLNETPERIARAFPGYFNKILIDAPCSGEGMFRKDEDMARQWERHSIAKCTVMQRDILRTAASLLAPGGRIVYSTCTFAPEENEAQIAAFLEQNPAFELISLPEGRGFSPGRPDWLAMLAEKAQALPEEASVSPSALEGPEADATSRCGRLWPHLIEGEGHFLAVLQHKGETRPVSEEPAGLSAEGRSLGNSPVSRQRRGRNEPVRHPGKKAPNERELADSWRAFASEHLAAIPDGEALWFGGHVYISPVAKERLDGLKTVRPGWYVGTVKNGRFQPGHPLAAALKADEALRVLDLSLADGEAIRYLKGETLEIAESRIRRPAKIGAKGFVLVTVDGFSLGFGKWLDGLLKNEYPAGWRWT